MRSEQSSFGQAKLEPEMSIYSPFGLFTGPKDGLIEDIDGAS